MASLKVSKSASKFKKGYILLFSFLFGVIFGEATADPISDYLFFLRESQGSLAPIEQVLYWFYLPTIVYSIILALAFLTYKFKILTSHNFVILFILLSGFSLVLSLKVLGFNPLVVLLMVIPFIFLIVTLGKLFKK